MLTGRVRPPIGTARARQVPARDSILWAAGTAVERYDLGRFVPNIGPKNEKSASAIELARFTLKILCDRSTNRQPRAENALGRKGKTDSSTAITRYITRIPSAQFKSVNARLALSTHLRSATTARREVARHSL